MLKLNANSGRVFIFTVTCVNMSILTYFIPYQKPGRNKNNSKCLNNISMNCFIYKCINMIFIIHFKLISPSVYDR